MESSKYTCTCGRVYVHNQSLFKHRKTCKQYLDSKMQVLNVKVNDNNPNEILLNQQIELLKIQLDAKNKTIETYENTQRELQQQINSLKANINMLQHIITLKNKPKCKSEWCDTPGCIKYEGYCMPCFVNNPENNNKPVVRNYKTKEKDVADRIIKAFPNFTWVADKRVKDGCSRRRPDLLLDMGSHVIIVEVDENKHFGYDCSCENKRIMELSQDLQHRPIVFIRFNPDDYNMPDGKLIRSCWIMNKYGVVQIEKTRVNEWEERINCLKQQIQYWADNPTEKTVEIVELYYS